MDDQRTMKDVSQSSRSLHTIQRQPSHRTAGFFAAALLALVGIGFVSIAEAAGPKAGEFYLQVGGGLFGPKFDLAEDAGVPRTDGPQETSTIAIARVVKLQISGSTKETEKRPENINVIAFGGTMGYKFTDHISTEAEIDIIFPEIQINDVGAGDVIGGDNNAGSVNVLQPGILPVAVSVVYTFFPAALISPYVGLGPLIGNFRNGRAWTDSGDLLKLQSSTSFGVVGKAGALLTVSQSSYIFLEGRYGYIDNPEVRDRQGAKVDVNSFDMLSVKGGVGFNF